MTIFLSPSAIFLRLDFTPIFTQHDEHSQPGITIYYGAGAQKNARIFKSNAPTWLKLGVGLDHMCTNGWNFLDPTV